MSIAMQIILGPMLGAVIGTFLGALFHWNDRLLPRPYRWAREFCLWLANLSFRGRP